MRTTLASTRLRIRPGTPTSLDIEVVNTSDVIDGVTATVFGLDAAWVQMSPPVLTLFPESVGRLTLLFDVPTVCPAGDSILLVRISSTVDPSRHVEHDVWLTVDPVEAATLVLRPSVIVGGRTADIDVQVTNLGNVTTEFVIAGLEPTRAVECIAPCVPVRATHRQRIGDVKECLHLMLAVVHFQPVEGGRSVHPVGIDRLYETNTRQRPQLEAGVRAIVRLLRHRFKGELLCRQETD